MLVISTFSLLLSASTELPATQPYKLEVGMDVFWV